MKIVLAVLSIGVGAGKTGMFLGHLDLPGANPLGDKSFSNIEKEIGFAVRDVGEMTLKYALEEETRLTLDENLEEWEKLPVEQREA